MNIKEIVKKIVYRYVPVPSDLSPSYSQAGEDRIIYFLFSTKNLTEKITYLDVGAYHAVINSNSYLFYKLGGRGVLVEADPSLADEIQRLRPRDKVVHAAVAEKTGLEMPFYRMNVPSGNTLVPDAIEGCNRSKLLHVRDCLLLTTISLNDILASYFTDCPDLLSLDIEGVDLAALTSIDYERFPIPVICVETCKFSESHVKPKDTSIEDFLLRKNYFVYADTYINTIFVNSSWFYSEAK